MTLAFVTGALASGLLGGGLAGVIIWIVTVLTGSTDPWSVAPLLVAATGMVVAAGTYVAERIVYRRGQQRQRAIGEPWAYRDD